MPAGAGVVVLEVDVVVPAGVVGVDEDVAVVSGDEEDAELVPAEVPADVEVEVDVFTCWEPLAEGELTLVFPPQPRKTVRTTNKRQPASVGRKRRRMKGSPPVVRSVKVCLTTERLRRHQLWLNRWNT
jgi:hypothetical protein